MKLVPVQTNYNTFINVASAKRECIENIIRSAASCKQISAIILFGSSLEERCTNMSDIDIAIVSKLSLCKLSQYKSFKTFCNDLYSYDDQEYDKLYFKSLEEIELKRYKVTICNELITKGKIIYKREEDIIA